ncbi:DEAD/DEAH box helicase [Ornithinimicrobium avium]|uniref:Helicase SNF2 n=1 Tax=Ornithinimicrobium avium TaxID=2283195 RepID=A0A345NK88_9MICO|nr:DEAD/DEAH box helicase [Ornithinimicrobium avium]AXH95446.1 helicase SNF2 [Ornithinimicrobium avium]
MPVPELVVPSWVLTLSRADLEDHFGRTTLQRGVTYQRQGAVHGLTMDRFGALTATVYGARRYQTSVWWVPDDDDPFADEIDSDCSCPVGMECKHAAAVLLQAQAQAWPGPAAARTSAVMPVPSWEALLSPVVADLAPAPADPSLAPLALQLDRQRSSPAAPARGLRLRPLLKGTSGAWVKSGASWSDLQHGYSRVHPGHRTALAAILQAYRYRAQISQWQTVGEWIDSDTLGSGLWALLADVERAGVALVTGHQGSAPVTLLDSPVELALDLTRDDAGDITLAPVVDLPGASEGPVLLGRPGHGLLAKDGTGLLLAPLSRPLTASLTALIGTAGALRVPAADTGRFLGRYYPALRQHARVTSSDGSVELPEIAPPRLGLVVSFEPDHLTRLHWTFRYAVHEEVLEVPLLRGLDVEADRSVVRDAAEEESLLASLDVLDGAPGLRIPVAGRSRLGVVLDTELTGWATVRFVQNVLPALQAREDVDVILVGEALPYEEIDEAPVVAVATRDLVDEPGGKAEGVQHGGPATQDWFDLTIEVSVGGRPVPLPTLLSALALGDEALLLPDGTWFALDAPELHTLRGLVEEARALQDHTGPGLRINRFQAGLWEELVSLGVVAEQSQRWQRTVGALLALDQLPLPEPPEGLLATLRDYQLDGYRWLSFLWEHELGGILADDMGLGKTVQVLAAAEHARAEGRLSVERPMLVVAPTSVIATWEQEAARFTPHLKVAAVTETAHRAGRALAETVAGAHVVVTSYTLLRIDEEHYARQPWSAVILDEAQAVKNFRSRTYQVVRRLRAPVKVAVTGTPLENSLMDLWALLSLGAPGLFPSPDTFGKHFRRPIESGADPERLGTLRRRIRPLMLRRTKEAVARDLPPKIEQVVRVPLNPSHRRIYDTHLQRERQRILGLLGDVDRNRIAILAALTRLRQLSLDVHLVVPDAPASARPSKVDALLEQLVEVVAEGHRCLVFSQFTGFLKVVRERLDAERVDHVYLDGRTRDRPRRIAQFTEGDAPVFLISLKAGGSGLTLTEADYVFVLDPWWNPAVEAQAVDRTHRIGQDKTVMVYRLVAQDTIEEKVVALQEHKRELFAKVVDEGGLMAAPLGADDIRALLEG